MRSCSLRGSLLTVAVLSFTVAACESAPPAGSQRYPTGSEKQHQSDPFGRDNPGTIFGQGGIQLFGGAKRRDEAQEGGGGIGVNSYLWRASLDTVSFMPLSSADPFGGVIITDWYAPPETPGERFKVTIYILDRQLRADGVRVAVFKQRNTGAGWDNSPIGENVGREMEDKILTRAREIRIQSAQTK